MTRQIDKGWRWEGGGQVEGDGERENVRGGREGERVGQETAKEA